MNSITLIYPYYRNPQMLQIQVDNWNSYPAHLKPHVRVHVVDDGSPEPAEDIFRSCHLKKALWRIDVNIPWNQHGARNLGAKVSGKDDSWLFFSDMDIVLDAGMVERLVAKQLDPARHYTFERAFKDARPRKVHCNTFLVQRGAYMQAGGYDEDYCGMYGGDGIFLRALEKIVPRQHLLEVVLLGYNNTVPDASTTEWPRDGEMKAAYLRKRGEKKANEDMQPKNMIRFPWHRVL